MVTAIITCVTDDYDVPKATYTQRDDVDWVFVTDSQLTARVARSLGWRTVILPRSDEHPNLRAKRPKMCPWEFTDANQSIWIDASYRVISDRFTADVMTFANPIAQFTHPWRDCVYDEMIASLALPKYRGLPLVTQVESYERQGHPEHWGLWAAGVIARRHTLEIKKFGYDWLDECRFWTYQDQISEPVVLRAHQLRPSGIPGTHLSNQWLTYEASERHT